MEAQGPGAASAAIEASRADDDVESLHQGHGGKDIEAAIGQVVAEDEDATVVVTVTETVIVTAIATVTDVADRTDPGEVDLTEIVNPHAQRAVSGDDVETETPVRLPLLKSNPKKRVIKILRVVGARRMKSDYSIVIQLYRYLMQVQL